MAAETKREQVGATIRAFLPADAAAVTEILKGSPEASQWTEWGLKELLGWRGVLALVNEGDRKVTGFVIGRQVAGEAEILNLAVIVAQRRKGEGGALLMAAFYEKHGFSKTGRRAGYYHDPDEAAIVMDSKVAG